MKLVLPLILMLLLGAAIAAAADLGNYPSMFFSGESFDAQIIVGSSAPATDTLAASEVAVSLQQSSSTRISAGLDAEYDSSKDAILIGLPCQNTAVAAVMGTNSCDLGLQDGSGYLKLTVKNSHNYLIVTGKTAADTRKAARLLAKYEQYNLSGTEMIVTGTLEIPVAQKLGQPLLSQSATSQIPSAGSCSTDKDCPEDNWCLTGNCADLGCPAGTTAQNHDCISAKVAGPTTAEKNDTPQVQQQKQQSTAATGKEPAKEAQAFPKKGFFTGIIAFFKSIFS